MYFNMVHLKLKRHKQQCTSPVQIFALKFADNLSDCNILLNELNRLLTHYQSRKLKLAIPLIEFK